MKGTRSRIVVGSLVGAAAIHLVMLACSGGGDAPPGSDAGSMDVTTLDADDRDVGADVATDRGADVTKDREESGIFDVVMDAVRDVMGDLVDAEVRDAQAGGDGGVVTRTCDCVPPTPTHTVSFTLNSPTEPIAPAPGFTTAETTVARQPGSMDVPMGLVRIESTATFWTGALRRSPSPVTLRCISFIRLPSRTLPPGNLPYCTLAGAIAVGTGDGTATFEVGRRGNGIDLEVMALTETQITYRIPRVAIEASAVMQPMFTFTNLTFSATIPGGHLLTPVDAFRAPGP